MKKEWSKKRNKNNKRKNAWDKERIVNIVKRKVKTDEERKERGEIKKEIVKEINT